MKKKLAAALSAALLAASLTATPAEAVTKSKHCGIYTTWRFTGADEDGTTRIRLYKKPSTNNRTAWCAVAYDLDKRSADVIVFMSTDTKALGSRVGSNKVSMLVRTPNTINVLLAEAAVIGKYVVYTGWWRR